MSSDPPPGVPWPWVAGLVALAAVLPKILKAMFGGNLVSLWERIRKWRKEDRKDALTEWQALAQALRDEVAGLRAEVRQLAHENGDLRQEIVNLRSEIARLRGVAA